MELSITKTEVLKLVETMQWIVERETKELEEWSRKLLADPLSSMSWGDSAVKSAALVTINKVWANAFMDEGHDFTTDEKRFKEVHRSLHDAVIRKTLFVSASTSQMHNLASLKEGQAMAELLEQVDSCAKRIRKATIKHLTEEVK